MLVRKTVVTGCNLCSVSAYFANYLHFITATVKHTKFCILKYSWRCRRIRVVAERDTVRNSVKFMGRRASSITRTWHYRTNLFMRVSRARWVLGAERVESSALFVLLLYFTPAEGLASVSGSRGGIEWNDFDSLDRVRQVLWHVFGSAVFSVTAGPLLLLLI